MATQTAPNFTQNSDFSLTPDHKRQFWDEYAQEGVMMHDILSELEGPVGSDKIIYRKDDTSKGKGQQINITVESELVGDGVQGATAQLGAEEKEGLSTYSLTVDQKREGVAVDALLESWRGAKRKAGLTDKLIRWMANEKQVDALKNLLRNGAYTTTGKANNLLWCGGGSADTSLRPSNVLDTNAFRLMQQKATSLGLQPTNLSRDENPRNGIFKMLFICPTDGLAGLDMDGGWNNSFLMAHGRENGADKGNPLFTGSYAKDYKGILPLELRVARHDNPSKGAIGSPLQPQALLRTATTNFTTTTILTFGGSGGTGTSIKWTKFFPGYDYLFFSSQTASADSTTYYLKIKDMPGATNAGKFEVCSYIGTANDGNQITVTRGSLTDGVSTSPDGIHDANALVVPCTFDGTEYVHGLCLGRGALLRGYGEWRERIAFEKYDYGEVSGSNISAIYGQTPCQRLDGVFKNFVVLRIAANNT